MNKHFAAAAALVLVCACGRGYTNGTTGPLDGSIPPTGNNIADGGDAGADGGDAGPDGGFDGGCVAASLVGLQVIDGCAADSGSANGIIDVSEQCAVQIFTNTATTNCIGIAHGANNAFDGGCGGFSNCFSSSLPGNIYCVTNGACRIQICDGGCGP